MGKGAGENGRSCVALSAALPDGVHVPEDVSEAALAADFAAAASISKLRGHQIATLRVVGSHAYGLAHKDSDTDLRGVYVAPTEQMLGLRGPAEQLESKDPDVVVFELGKFVRLASAANPNVLEILWAPEVRGDHVGALLSEHRHLFLSRRVRTTYGGYAHSQLKKLAAVEVNRPEKREKFARHLFRLFEQGDSLLRTGDMNIRVSDPEKLREMSRWPLEKIEREFLRLEAELDRVDSPLPEQPNLDALEQLLLDIRLAGLRR